MSTWIATIVDDGEFSSEAFSDKSSAIAWVRKFYLDDLRRDADAYDGYIPDMDDDDALEAMGADVDIRIDEWTNLVLIADTDDARTVLDEVVDEMTRTDADEREFYDDTPTSGMYRKAIVDRWLRRNVC